MTKRASSKNGASISIATASPSPGGASTNDDPRQGPLQEDFRIPAICTLDRGGRITTWTSVAERITGYNAWEIVGRHFSIFYAPEDDAAAEPTSHLLAAVDGLVEYEAWRVRKNRTRFWARISLTPLRDRCGELQGFVELTEDLTGRPPMEVRKSIPVEKRLEHSDVLSAQASHTLESAFASVRVHIEALRRTITTSSDESASARLDMLEWGLDRLTSSVAHVVKLAEDIDARTSKDIERP